MPKFLDYLYDYMLNAEGEQEDIVWFAYAGDGKATAVLDLPMMDV